MTTLNGYGSAEVVRDADGSPRVVRADDVIGVSTELLAQALGVGLFVDSRGLMCLAGDSAYRYRPVRFAVLGPQPLGGEAMEGHRVVVCERVR